MEKLYLYNTLSKSKEEFKPISDKIVGLYTCGPTVYNYAHLGNLRTYIFEDILKRTLLYNSYKVNHIMNITDVGHLTGDRDMGEDKLEKGAQRENKSAWEIAEFYTKTFKEDLEKLNILEPTQYCKATDYIEEQIDLVKTLESKGYTYKTSDGIYFDTSKVKDYTKLSHQKLANLQEGARVEKNDEKKNPTDFALWKFSPTDAKRQMEWHSPWGIGFPGWHIECSAMSMKLLKNNLDIHCGGIDHINVHHTNEIAQSEAYLGHKWCNYWIHGEHLNDISGKMAKSKGEFLTISLLINKGYNPLAYRFMCLQSHYRKQLLFTYESLDIASQSYNKLKSKINSLKKEATNLNLEVIDMYKNKFKEALEDNLNTSNALTVLFDVLKDEVLNDYNKLVIIEDFDRVLSLDLTLKDNNIPKEIEDLVNERNIAKTNKDFSKSDEIRDKLLSMGYTIKDTRDGTIVERR